jgi:prepilin-type N-terminal cleavage/methylation domain-containing protein
VAAGSARARSGFTLIEIMAVIVVIGLALALVLPNLSATRSAQLRDRARLLAGRIELARERAIVTGAPHRVMIDLEEGSYAVDWWVTESRALAVDEEASAAQQTAAPATDYSGNAPISLSPPTEDVRDYYPIPGRFGELAFLSRDYFFEGVDTPEGWIDRGYVQIVFERDGTSDAAEIVLMDAWENRVRLQVEPLLDIVRIRSHEED